MVGRTDAEAYKRFEEMNSLERYYRLPKPLLICLAEHMANDIQQWYEAGALDMLLLRQEHPRGLQDFVELVVPLLQARGIFHTEYAADTLRGNLELPKPAFRTV